MVGLVNGRKDRADRGAEGWNVRCMMAGCDRTVPDLSSGHC